MIELQHLQVNLGLDLMHGMRRKRRQHPTRALIAFEALAFASLAGRAGDNQVAEVHQVLGNRVPGECMLRE